MKRILLIWVAALPLLAQVQRLTISDAERMALANHPRIKAANLEAAAAGQQVVEQRSNFFPILSGNFTGAGAGDNNRIAAGALNNPVIFSRLASGVNVSQLLYDFGRTSKLVSSSRYNALAQQSTAQAAREDVLLEVDRAYYRALRSQAVLRVADQTVKARQTVDDQVHALAQSKLKSGLDVSFADVNLSQAKLLLVSAQNDVEASFAELAAAMGSGTPQSYDLADTPVPPTAPEDFAGALRTAVQKRPELASLRSSEQAAQAFYKSEKNLWLPSVSAVSALGVVPDHGVQLPGKYAAAGVNISIPIFNGRLFSARREEADLRAQAAAARLSEEELRVRRDVRMAWLAAQDAWQKLDLTRQLLDQAGQALDLAQARYDMGLSSIVELTQAQLGLTQAQIEQVTAKYDYQMRLAELDYQQGTL